jgi:hypothetical protein
VNDALVLAVMVCVAAASFAAGWYAGSPDRARRSRKDPVVQVRDGDRP